MPIIQKTELANTVLFCLSAFHGSVYTAVVACTKEIFPDLASAF